MTLRAHTWGALALVLSAGLIWPAAAPGSTFPGWNGDIAFLSGDHGWCLQMVKSDGSGRHAPGACGYGVSGPARISPDGTRVVMPYPDPDDFDLVAKRNTKLDGSDPILFAGSYHVNPFMRWSPDGIFIAIAEQYSPTSCCDAGGLYVVPADGSGPGHGIGTSYRGVWSNSGRIAWTYNDYDCECGDLSAVNGDGTGGFTNIYSGQFVGQAEWSPSSDRLIFSSDVGLAFINADGTGLQPLTTNADAMEWSPDGQQILLTGFGGGNAEIRSITANGTGHTNLTNHPAADRNPIWSPDSTKIAFESDRDGPTQIFVMNRDGSNVVQVTDDPGGVTLQDWQSIPINAYPRPRGATPIQVSIVPAYNQCTAPNRTHGPPLAFPSCASPGQISDELTVGTPDANAKPAKSRGTVRYDAIAGAPATPADEADVQVSVELFDIYEQGTMADYTGDLTARVALRITDKLNTPHPGGPGAATVSDASLDASVPCAATADPTEGASCNVVTTFDAIVPGTVTETKRSIWALGPAQLYDGNDDLFMTQGLFIP